tara:strand:- start:349 stop:1485 length:1137 start_codon:yes stop_codon:yes gene_type:complete
MKPLSKGIYLLGSIMVFACIHPSSAHAEDTDSLEDRSMRTGPPTPSGRFDTVGKSIDLGLDISEQEAEASASIGGHVSVTQVDAGGVQRQNALLWRVGVELPIGGSSDLFDDPTLDVLSDSVKFSGSLTWKRYSNDPSKVNSRKFQSLVDQAMNACIAAASSTTDEQNCRSDRARFGLETYVRQHLEDADIQIARALYSGFYTFGVAGSVAVKRFQHTASGSLTENKDTKESFSLTATGTYYPSDAVSAWKLQAEYGNGFEELDKIPICRTVIIDPEDDCVFDAPGVPNKVESLVLRGEYRRYFPINGNDRGIGIAPLLSVDTLSGDLGVEFPIFYNLDGDSPVAPGIKFGYKKDSSKPNNEDEALSIALFLKTTFGY